MSNGFPVSVTNFLPGLCGIIHLSASLPAVHFIDSYIFAKLEGKKLVLFTFNFMFLFFF